VKKLQIIDDTASEEPMTAKKRASLLKWRHRVLGSTSTHGEAIVGETPWHSCDLHEHLGLPEATRFFVGVDIPAKGYRERTGVILMRVDSSGNKAILKCSNELRKSAIALCMKRKGVAVEGGHFVIEVEEKDNE
jgi:hypothetical protein